MWVLCLHVSAQRGEKRVFDLLGLKLQTIESHHGPLEKQSVVLLTSELSL